VKPARIIAALIFSKHFIKNSPLEAVSDEKLRIAHRRAFRQARNPKPAPNYTIHPINKKNLKFSTFISKKSFQKVTVTVIFVSTRVHVPEIQVQRLCPLPSP